MHHIQRRILSNLIRHQTQRYKDLKPAGIDANLFMYHLRQLQKEGLVIKAEDGSYCLSPKGLLDADRRGLEDDRLVIYDQPRLLLLLAVRDDTKGWLLHTRSVQPVINMTGFIHANFEAGEPAAAVARKRLKELAGLDGTFDYRGSATILMYHNADIESYVHALIMYCQNPKGSLQAETPIGANHWDKQINFQAKDLLPSMEVLVDNLTKNETFFVELTYKLD